MRGNVFESEVAMVGVTTVNSAASVHTGSLNAGYSAASPFLGLNKIFPA